MCERFASMRNGRRPSSEASPTSLPWRLSACNRTSLCESRKARMKGSSKGANDGNQRVMNEKSSGAHLPTPSSEEILFSATSSTVSDGERHVSGAPASARCL